MSHVCVCMWWMSMPWCVWRSECVRMHKWACHDMRVKVRVRVYAQMSMPWHACEGQRTASLTDAHIPPGLRQGLLEIFLFPRLISPVECWDYCRGMLPCLISTRVLSEDPDSVHHVGISSYTQSSLPRHSSAILTGHYNTHRKQP